MRGTARENRVVVYLDDDDHAALTRRAERRSTSANLYAKELIKGALREDSDGVVNALNLLAQTMTKIHTELSARIDELAESQTEQGQEILKLRESVREDFKSLAELLSR